jgi:hypothetical protein
MRVVWREGFPATKRTLPQETVRISLRSKHVSSFSSLSQLGLKQRQPCFRNNCSAESGFSTPPEPKHLSLIFLSLPFSSLLSIFKTSIRKSYSPSASSYLPFPSSTLGISFSWQGLTTRQGISTKLYII